MKKGKKKMFRNTRKHLSRIIRINSKMSFDRAIALGEYAYANRHYLKRQGRIASRMYRRYNRGKRRAPSRRGTRFGGRRLTSRKRRRPNPMSKVGERRGTSTSKSTVLIQDATARALDTRTLYLQDLAKTQINSSTNRIKNRDTDVAFLKGVKFCWEVRNGSTKPMYFNWAVVVPKALVSPSNDDFFRGNDLERGQSFDALQLTGNDFHCRPINADKYLVIKHMRMILGPTDGKTNINFNTSKSNFMNLNRYVKINRQFRYEGNSTAVEGRKPWLAYWFDEVDTPAGDAAKVGRILITESNVLYFKDAK